MNCLFASLRLDIIYRKGAENARKNRTYGAQTILWTMFMLPNETLLKELQAQQY